MDVESWAVILALAGLLLSMVRQSNRFGIWQGKAQTVLDQLSAEVGLLRASREEEIRLLAELTIKMQIVDKLHDKELGT